MVLKKAQSAMEFAGDVPRKHRGQSAMEFLMTYGWAILIMLLVIAILFYVGIINPQNVAPNSIAMPAGFSAYDYYISPSGYLTLDLGHSMGRKIYIRGIKCTNSLAAENPNDKVISLDPAINELVADGDVYCHGIGGDGYYKGFVYIWYQVQGSNVTHEAVGDLSYRIKNYDPSAPTPTAEETPDETPDGTPEDGFEEEF